MVWSYSIWSLLFLYLEPGGLALGTNGDVNDQSPALAPAVYGLMLAGGLGPSTMGIVTTRLVDGQVGTHKLWVRFRNTRGGGGGCGQTAAIWLTAALLIPAITALTPLLRWAAGYPQDGSAMLSRVGPGLALGIVAGLMEEFGWRGFLLPQLLLRRDGCQTRGGEHLRLRQPPFRATLVVGLIWGLLWHGYADYFGVGGKGAATLVLILLLGPVLLTAWSLLLTLLFMRTDGSLILSVTMHASISSSALIFGQSYASVNEEMAWTAISVGIAVASSTAIWFGAVSLLEWEKSVTWASEDSTHDVSSTRGDEVEREMRSTDE
jgi:membrane protease YdiL (CAAX protease family)